VDFIAIQGPGTVLGGVYNGGKGGRENLMKQIWKLTSASIFFTWDVFRFCFSAMPSLDLIIVCLEREKQNISKPCQTVMSTNGTLDWQTVR